MIFQFLYLYTFVFRYFGSFLLAYFLPSPLLYASVHNVFSLIFLLPIFFGVRVCSVFAFVYSVTFFLFTLHILLNYVLYNSSRVQFFFSLPSLCTCRSFFFLLTSFIVFLPVVFFFFHETNMIQNKELHSARSYPSHVFIIDRKFVSIKNT